MFPYTTVNNAKVIILFPFCKWIIGTQIFLNCPVTLLFLNNSPSTPVDTLGTPPFMSKSIPSAFWSYTRH